jgi:hypothetical protein
MLGHKDVSIREHAAKAFGKLKIDAGSCVTDDPVEKRSISTSPGCCTQITGGTQG